MWPIINHINQSNVHDKFISMFTWAIKGKNKTCIFMLHKKGAW